MVGVDQGQGDYDDETKTRLSLKIFQHINAF